MQAGTQLDGDLRGTVDLNFTYDDGSTRRLNELKRVDEDRTVTLPYYPGGSANLEIYVPPGQ